MQKERRDSKNTLNESHIHARRKVPHLYTDEEKSQMHIKGRDSQFHKE